MISMLAATFLFFAMLYYYYFAEMIDYDTLSKQRVRSKQELQDAGH